MNIALILAAVALVPQPAKLVETGGATSNAAIRYVTDSAVPAEEEPAPAPAAEPEEEPEKKKRGLFGRKK